ncbi:TonB-dependent receptor plug domain-containing protein [Melioribacter sp. OK-6-Me]|uniref:TonB-dependent receptor plug domain-containing protein n=1 Tax=unclassified Melioribacter TaxID=2627329 RepID=UPI003ED8F1A3
MKASITLLLIFSFSFLNAQTDTLKTTLSEVVVTATKTETPYYAIASSVTVFTRDEIENSNLNDVIDLLRRAPGISITQQGGRGRISYSFIRGANSNHTLVYIDGIKMNDPTSPNNAFDFANLTTDDIERIEIVRGPQSTLYGADAAAGIINIITQKAGANNYSLNAEAGSHSTFKGALNLNSTIGKLNYFINLSRHSTEGISASNSKYGNTEDDGYTNNGITVKLNYPLLNNLNAEFLYKYIKTNTDLDQNDKYGDDPNYTYKNEDQVFKAALNYKGLENLLEQSLVLSATRKFANAIDLPDDLRPSTSSDSYNRGTRLAADFMNILHLNSNTITAGVAYEKETAYTNYLSNSQWGEYASTFPESSMDNVGIYLQDQINIAGKIFITAGIRFDKHSKYGNKTTYRFAPSYFISQTGTKIKLSYGTGFKAPSLYYLLDPLYGNPELKPEETTGLDIGIEQSLIDNKFITGITYFQLDMKNMFGYDENYKTINIAEAESNGLETYINLRNYYGVDLNFSYTYNKTKDKYLASEDYGKELLRRPAHQLFFSAGYQIDRFYLAAELKYKGSRYDKDFSVYPAQRVELSPYTLVNFSVSFKLTDKIRLYGRIDNIFNEDYEEILYYGTYGRSLYGGIKLSM